ncbi:MAG TPA: thioesterase [Bacteroidales bacterium]|nr:hypothetical protein [Bacteroidales bacterium]HPE57205.1 thioesterase [Bacteroidales bacterium]HRX97692.1 thioesterase [Bacteroidales bacterium]
MNSDSHQTEYYNVFWHDTDQNGQMSFAAISRYLQETAWRHADRLGFGYNHAREVNQFWVLLRQRIVMDVFPKWNDQISIETWPRGTDGFWAFRDYLIRNEREEIIGRVTSSWMLIDMDTHRPQKPDLVQHAMMKTDLQLALENNADKVLFEKEGIIAEHRTVKATEIDLNSHVTNAKYADWIADTLASVYPERKFFNYHINFLTEAIQTDEVVISYYENEELIKIKACRKSDQKNLFIAELS